jgi:hypothetical protein
VTLTTRFPDLRRIFLACKHLQKIEILSANAISELWKRQDDVSGMGDLVFFLQFAAACLVNTDIAPLMEGSSRDVLWNVGSASRGPQCRRAVARGVRLLVSFDPLLRSPALLCTTEERLIFRDSFQLDISADYSGVLLSGGKLGLCSRQS